jgi:hypothetical protein
MATLITPDSLAVKHPDLNEVLEDFMRGLSYLKGNPLWETFRASLRDLAEGLPEPDRSVILNRLDYRSAINALGVMTKHIPEQALIGLILLLQATQLQEARR